MSNVRCQMNERRTVIKLAALPLLPLPIATSSSTPRAMNVRTSQEVATRSLALLAIIKLALDQPGVHAWVRENALEKHLSKQEAKFFRSAAHTERQRINFSWRSEALVPLLWALKQIDEMPPLNVQTGLAGIVDSRALWSAPKKFLTDAVLRNTEELLNAREDAFDGNWKARDARINGRNAPAEVEPGIAQERHQALNWLVGDSGDDWDTVATDT
jgi:hypothetical protein